VYACAYAHEHTVKQLGFVESMLIVFQLIIVARSFALPASQGKAYAGAIMTTRIYMYR